jgi:hypothetical protein
MEYTNINQLSNIIFDISKDHENKLLSIHYVFERVKELCPTINFNKDNYCDIFIETCKQINDVYDFIHCIKHNNKYYILYSNDEFVESHINVTLDHKLNKPNQNSNHLIYKMYDNQLQLQQSFDKLTRQHIWYNMALYVVSGIVISQIFL